MDRATPAVVAFKEVIDSKLLAPVQRNLFTGELEPVEIEIDRPIPEDETEIDDGIEHFTLANRPRHDMIGNLQPLHDLARRPPDNIRRYAEPS